MTNHFTPTYIAMAKAADEIQAMRPPFEQGDAFLDAEFSQVVFAGYVYPQGGDLYSARGEDYEVDFIAWIPRLDQLLGMLGGPDEFLGIIRFNPTAKSETMRREYHRFTDWHELALAMVMREKHRKTWDGNGWVTP